MSEERTSKPALEQDVTENKPEEENQGQTRVESQTGDSPVSEESQDEATGKEAPGSSEIVEETPTPGENKTELPAEEEKAGDVPPGASSPEQFDEKEREDDESVAKPINKEEDNEVVKEEEKEEKKEEKLPVDETAKSEKTGSGDSAEAEVDEDEDAEEEEEHLEGEDLQEKYDKLNRQELVGLLEETVKETDISKIKTKVALIKVAFLKTTKEEQHTDLEKSMSDESLEAKPEDDPLQERFNLAFGVYKQNKVAYQAEQEKNKKKNLDAKLQILEELKELINSEETLKKTYDEFKVLQDRWKETGMVPRSEVNNLWQSYHFLVEKFFDKVKINKELRDLDLKKNLEKKVELCEQAEELLLETSIIKSFKQLQKLHEQYKEIGPVPADKKDEVWERFKTATDKINQRRREHYSKLAEQQNSNYEAKLALCEKAEEVLSRKNDTMKEWQKNTSSMNELFKVWRTIGPAPKKSNDEIWKRFKSSLNIFFENRREYFNKLKEEQINNYNLKLDLCTQAEALQDSTDWRKTTDDLIRLQKDWKKIGPVPRKYSDKIWKRFRVANDYFFNKKSEYFANIHEHEADNLNAKKELIQKVKDFEFGDDKNQNLKVIKDFQRQWMEIGHVPIKEKDSIQDEFRKTVDAELEKLKISAVEISTLNYKAKVDAIKEIPNSKRNLARERNYLSNRIGKLKEDVILWENNVGFLADSKKADVLKKEFSKKIEKAKQDIKIMEAKLKYLNTQA